MSKDDIELEILDLEDKYKATRNPVEKADISSKISNLKKCLANCDAAESKAVLQKDVPARADHKEEKDTSRRQITNTDEVFTALI